MTTVGFIGLGNVGSKLAGTLVRSGVTTIVLDRDPAAMAPLLESGCPARQFACRPCQSVRSNNYVFALTCNRRRSHGITRRRAGGDASGHCLG